MGGDGIEYNAQSFFGGFFSFFAIACVYDWVLEAIEWSLKGRGRGL